MINHNRIFNDENEMKEFVLSCEDNYKKQVIDTANTWADNNRIMYVAGATRPEMLCSVREAAPDRFLLIPGIGAQGGSLEKVMQYGKTADGDLLLHVSRAIVQSEQGPAEAARLFAESMVRFFS